MRAASSFRWIGSVVFVGLVVSMMLSGCRPGTALHSRYNDFRAYYNAYYNAERKLEEGEEALQARNQKVDRGRLVELFPTGSATGRNNTFQETVDKSAELLRDRPGSKWADDALLLIGKAYFYQRNFVGAEQKFRETAEAAAVRDEPRLADEARFWLGRTYAATERYEEGVAVLQDALAQTEIDPRWRAQIQLALGELYGRAERWSDAATALRAGVEAVGDRELAARAYLLLGQVEEASGNWDAAVEAYDLAARRAPAYELGYAARLSGALTLGLDAGRTEEALERIRTMRRDDKNFQQRAEVELAWARIQAASGDASGARARFRDILYDESLAGSAMRGEAHYRLAEYYRDVEKDFVRAAAHFDTAATALPAPPEASVQLSRAAIRNARRESDTFASISMTSQRIAEIDSLVTLALLSEDAFEARIQEIEAERLRVFLEEQRETNQLRANEAFRNVDDRGEIASSQQTDAALVRNIGGFLGHRDPSSVQAGRIAFEQTWGDRTLVPNWRRRAAIEASTVTLADRPGGVTQTTGRPADQGPPPLDLSAIPRTPEQRQALDTELAELRYELANALFLSLGRADSAVVLYRRILDETPEAPVAPRARYALAEVEYAAGRFEAATPLFEAVIDDDPESELARAARLRLGIDEPVQASEQVPGLADRSAEQFAEARRQWTSGDPLEAMQAFIALGEANPDAPIARRAFLAGAAAYADYAQGDTLLLLAALPDSLAPALFRDTTAMEPIPESAGLASDERQLEDMEAPPPSPTERRLDEEDILPDRDPASRAADEVSGVDNDVELLQRPRRPPVVARPDDEQLDSSPLDDDDEVVPRKGVPQPVAAPTQDDEDERVPLQPEPEAVTESDEAVPDSLLAGLGTPPNAADPPISPAPVPSDSPDSVVAIPDAGFEPDSLDADSLRVSAFTLADYLAALAERYPGTIEAEQAERLRTALPRDPSEASQAAAAPVQRSQPNEPDDDREPEPPPPSAAPVDLNANPYGTFGSQPLNPAAGGFSRRTNGLADAVEASVLVRQLVEEGFRASVATDGVDVFVVVGQYPTDKDLALATAELPAATLGAGTGIVRLEDIELLPLANGEDDQ